MSADMPASDASGFGFWPRVRAGLIALVLACGLIAGAPIPAESQLERWPSWLRRPTDALIRVHAVLVAPLQPIGNALVLSQRWGVFSGASRQRYWLSVEGRERRGRWRLLYRPHDPKHQLLSEVLEYRRVRGVWNPRAQDPRPGYSAFVSFIAGRMFAERPELAAVRVRLERVQILPGGRGFAPSGEFFHEVSVRRSEVRR